MCTVYTSSWFRIDLVLSALHQNRTHTTHHGRKGRRADVPGDHRARTDAREVEAQEDRERGAAEDREAEVDVDEPVLGLLGLEVRQDERGAARGDTEYCATIRACEGGGGRGDVLQVHNVPVRRKAPTKRLRELTAVVYTLASSLFFDSMRAQTHESTRAK